MARKKKWMGLRSRSFRRTLMIFFLITVFVVGIELGRHQANPVDKQLEQLEHQVDQLSRQVESVTQQNHQP